MDENSPRRKIATLYPVTGDEQITNQEEVYAASNGLAWSANGRIMYNSSCTVGIIEAWDFDPATGDRTYHRTLAKLTNDDRHPDGPATDAAGNYRSAGPSARYINCFRLNGEPLRNWGFPVPGPTMARFAADSLRDLPSPGEVSLVLANFNTWWSVQSGCVGRWRLGPIIRRSLTIIGRRRGIAGFG